MCLINHQERRLSQRIPNISGIPKGKRLFSPIHVTVNPPAARIPDNLPDKCRFADAAGTEQKNGSGRHVVFNFCSNCPSKK